MEKILNVFTEKDINDGKTKAVLVSAFFKDTDKHDAEVSLEELERLLETAGGVCEGILVQNKTAPDPATYLGSGKLYELKQLCIAKNASLVVFDAELTPSQIRNIENAIKEETSETDIIVIDRSMLILDIFALHANTAEGKLQVELALLKYSVPRLTGKGLQMSRLGGGIGTRGPGESKLESDKRHLKRRMDMLEEELENVEKNRAVQRKQRDKAGLYRIAIAGYTNAGKSTLLNYLTNAGILAENKLFATLDPTTRKYKLPDGNEVLFTDTVGFIRNLPHHLINAFRSTLDEVAYSDAVLVLIDASEEECAKQLEVTENLLEELGAGEKPVLYVYNKCDMGNEVLPLFRKNAGQNDIFFISAKTGEGVDTLIERITKLVNESRSLCTFVFPFDKQGQMNILYKNASVISTDYLDDKIVVKAVCDAKTKGMLSDFIETENN